MSLTIEETNIYKYFSTCTMSTSWQAQDAGYCCASIIQRKKKERKERKDVLQAKSCIPNTRYVENQKKVL